MRKLCILVFIFLIQKFVFTQNQHNNIQKNGVEFKIQSISYLYHLFNIEGLSAIPPEDRRNLHEGFENFFTSIIVKPFPRGSFVIGATLNSFGETSFVVGYRRRWLDFSKRFSLVGQYCYIGEFFFKVFSTVGYRGDPSVYRSFREKTGVGFAPFIFHGINYKINSIVSVEMGLVFPNLLAGTFIFNLRKKG